MSVDGGGVTSAKRIYRFQPLPPPLRAVPLPPLFVGGAGAHRALYHGDIIRRGGVPPPAKRNGRGDPSPTEQYHRDIINGNTKPSPAEKVARRSRDG